jgi:hypothetical protein
VKEGSYLQRETSAEDVESSGEGKDGNDGEAGSEHAKERPVAIEKS